MDLHKNLGICYKGDYITQGSINDKAKKSNQLGINYTEFIIRNDGKDMDFSNVSSLYSGKIIFHVPTINISQSNLKEIKEIVLELLKNNPVLLTIDASSLLYETFDWSTAEEQQNYLKNISKGIATIASNNIPVAIENVSLYNNSEIFGKTISNMSDILIYTKNTLVEQFDISREKANELVGISLNVGNIMKSNKIVNLENWIKVFYNDIKCIKVTEIENIIPLFNQLLTLVINNELDVPIILESKNEIEGIVNDYGKFEHLVKEKMTGNELNLDSYRNIVNSKLNEYNYNFNTSQSGYTNIVIIGMILFTVLAAVLMLYVQLKH